MSWEYLTPLNQIKQALELEAAAKNQIWQERISLPQQNQVLALTQKYLLDEVLAKILIGRGVELDDAVKFLSPKLKYLMPDPKVLKDVDRAGERIVKAILSKEKLAIFGDYDVDGVSSSSICKQFFTFFKLEPYIYIPDRELEGYGPNRNAIQSLIDAGCSLIILVDCGAASEELLLSFKEQKVDFIVLDHHQMGSAPKDALIMVNPNRPDDFSNLNYLCAAGVVFMTLVHVLRLLKDKSIVNLPNLLDLVDLVALATICDIVPLKGLNRAFVITGLNVMNKLNNHGLVALTKTAKIGQPVNTYHCGYILGPRLNAGGRIAHAKQAVELLTSTNMEVIDKIAENLEELNLERRTLEKQFVEEALTQAAYLCSKDVPDIMVVAADNWHVGLVGLVAARIKERFNRPTFAIAFNAEGIGVGSGRSIDGFDIGKLVRDAVDNGLLLAGGGHKMAAGLRIEKANLPKFIEWVNLTSREQIKACVAKQTLKFDTILPNSAISIETCQLIEKAGPYGAEYPSPIIVLKDQRIVFNKYTDAGHLLIHTKGSDGKKTKMVAFNAADTELAKFLDKYKDMLLHFAGNLSINYYQGTMSPSFRIVDIALAKHNANIG